MRWTATRSLLILMAAFAQIPDAQATGGCSRTKSLDDPFTQQLIAEGAIHIPGALDNVGYYEWNAELGEYVLVESWVDDSLQHAPISLLSGDTIEQYSQFPGGVEYQDGRTGCGGPPTLPPVIVTASPSPSFLPFIRFVGFGNVGNPVAVNRTGPRQMPNNPFNTDPATCTTDQTHRHGHANQDAGYWQSRNPLTALRMRAGDEVRVTYDDGGSEIWFWTISTGSDRLAVIPKPNTLRCP